jgi:hypothetical protein
VSDAMTAVVIIIVMMNWPKFLFPFQNVSNLTERDNISEKKQISH